MMPPWHMFPLLPRLSCFARAAVRQTLGIAAVAGVALAFAVPSPAQQAAPAAASAPGSDPTALFNAAVTGFDRGDYQGTLAAIDTLLGPFPPICRRRRRPSPRPCWSRSISRSARRTSTSSSIHRPSRPSRITSPAIPRAPAWPKPPSRWRRQASSTKDYAVAAQGFATLENSPAFREQALLLEGISYKEAREEARPIAALEKLTAGGIKSPTAAHGAMQSISLYSGQKQPDKALKMLSAVQANIDQLENVVELNTVALAQGDAYLQNNANSEALTCYRAVRTREQVIAIEEATASPRCKSGWRPTRPPPAPTRRRPRGTSFPIGSCRIPSRRISGSWRALRSCPTIYPKVLYRIGRALLADGPAVGGQRRLPGQLRPLEGRRPTGKRRFSRVITPYAEVNQAGRGAHGLQPIPQGISARERIAVHGRLPARRDRVAGKRPEGGRNVLRPDARRTTGQHLARGDALPARQRAVRASQVRRGAGPSTPLRADFPQGTHFEEAVYREALAQSVRRRLRRRVQAAWRIS